jgi:hypothetical protein
LDLEEREMAVYPVTYEADYSHRHSRLTVFFRGVLAIPHILFLLLWSIVLVFAIIGAWFALLFTAHYPKGLYNFVSHYNRYLARLRAYLVYIVDKYPPFGGELHDEYAIRVHYAGPLPKYSRLRVFFRGLLALPLLAFVAWVINPLVSICGFAGWIVIVITGRLPKGLHDLLVMGTSYETRAMTYFLYLTQNYPPFSQDLAAGATGSTQGVIEPAPKSPPPAPPATE